MYLKLLSNCAVEEIVGIGTDAPENILKKLGEGALSPFYLFSETVTPDGETPNNAARALREFVDKNSLGSTWVSDVRVNPRHPDHANRVFIWSPDQEAVGKWLLKNKPVALEWSVKWYRTLQDHPYALWRCVVCDGLLRGKSMALVSNSGQAVCASCTTRSHVTAAGITGWVLMLWDGVTETGRPATWSCASSIGDFQTCGRLLSPRYPVLMYHSMGERTGDVLCHHCQSQPSVATITER